MNPLTGLQTVQAASAGVPSVALRAVDLAGQMARQLGAEVFVDDLYAAGTVALALPAALSGLVALRGRADTATTKARSVLSWVNWKAAFVHHPMQIRLNSPQVGEHTDRFCP